MKINGPIIVIDDDKDDQIIIKYVVDQIGIHTSVHFFDDCNTALTYLKETKEQPFIILCDINLPAMSGLQFRYEINQDEQLRRKSIPFVFITTTAMRHQVVEAYNLTVQGFFIKQTSVEDMKITLKRIFEYWLDCIHPNTVR